MSDLLIVLMKIFAAGAVAEVVLPWGLVVLSNEFIFDIPSWSLWLVFAGPPVLAIAGLVYAWNARSAARGNGAR